MTNVTEIPEEYSELKQEYVALRKEIELMRQELHGSKRQIQLFEALKVDYQSEIELLQSKENSEKNTLREKIKFLEECNNNLTIRYSGERQSLENRVLKLEEENEHLNTEIEFLKKTNITDNSNNTSKFIDEIVDLKEENESLLFRIEEMKISLELLQSSKSELEENIQEKNREITELKDSLACKREELCDAKNLIQKLNEETLCLKTELENYKSQPLDKLSKGNSLFAEVDDRRVYLQKTINNMKAEFIAMKQERTKHLDTIRRLKLESKMFLEKWKSDINEKEEDTYTLIKSYKNQIAVLEKMIGNYKKDLEAKPISFSEDGFEAYEFYNVMLNDNKKAIEELREQLAAEAFSETLLSQALRQANEEKRNWKLEACIQQKHLEIKLEKDRLDSIDQSIEKTTSINYQTEDVKNNRVAKNRGEVITIDDTSEDEGIDQIENKLALDQNNSLAINAKSEELKTEVKESFKNEYDKENQENNFESGAVGKRVTFAANSISPKKSGIRKCRKVIVCKPVHFSTLQKPK